MPDPRLSKLANVLVDYSTQVRPGEWVHITAGRIAVPLVREVVRRVLEVGGYPTTSLDCDELEEVYLTHGNEAQLQWASPVDMFVIEAMKVSIFIAAPENTRVLSAIDPARQQMRQSAYRQWTDTYMRRSASGDLRWVMTNYPCLALAQEAEMSLTDYEDFVFGATFVDRPDPVQCWQQLYAEQERLVKWLAGKKMLAIRGPHANLSLSIEGRKFINSAGDQNMPSGEIFTGPVENSANGWVEFSYPAITMGRAVEGIRMEFKDGRVVKATAEKNEDFLLKMLDIDPGARYLGELGLGTNYGIQRFTRDILYDEKIGGTFHLAVGNSYPETGGVNQSSIHWDFICDAKTDTEIHVDGELFYRDGHFQV
ncbi:MAG: aminopeptidase [Anaerolineae bacterium]|nr:aminopeptidase [Anaerolineae bacterium]